MHLVADRDRDRVSASLRRHYLLGRLTLEELSERVELALRARSDGELRAALRGLPAPWHPSELAPVADAAGRFARRAFLLVVLGSLWVTVTFVLLVALLLALATDASTETQLAIPILWAGSTWVAWRTWRRAAVNRG
jgi:Domain of unknown function (DUF1707)